MIPSGPALRPGRQPVRQQSGHPVRRPLPGSAGASPGSPLPAAGQSGATFVAAGSGGLAGPLDLTFGPDGNLYVANGHPYGHHQHELRGAGVRRRRPAASSPRMSARVPAASRNPAGSRSTRTAGSTSRTSRRTRSTATTARATTSTTCSSVPRRRFSGPIGIVFDAQGRCSSAARHERGRPVRPRRDGDPVGGECDARERELRDGRRHRRAPGRLHGRDRHRHLRAGPDLAADPARDPRGTCRSTATRPSPSS